MELRQRRATAAKALPVAAATSTAPKSKAGSSAPSRKLKYKEQLELAGMEAAIAAAEEEVARLQETFASPDFYKLHAQHGQLQSELDEAKAKVATLYARWEELEAINASANG